jgi:hypothetical protein
MPNNYLGGGGRKLAQGSVVAPRAKVLVSLAINY